MSNESDFVKKYHEFIHGFEGQNQIALARAEWHYRANRELGEAEAAAKYDYDDISNANALRRMQQRALVYRYFQAAGAIQCPKWIYDVWAEQSIYDDTAPGCVGYASAGAFKSDNWLLLTGPLEGERENLRDLVKEFRDFSDVFRDHSAPGLFRPSWHLMVGLDAELSDVDVPATADDSIDFDGVASIRYVEEADELFVERNFDLFYVFNFDARNIQI